MELLDLKDDLRVDPGTLDVIEGLFETIVACNEHSVLPLLWFKF